jgi:hypothetical protein
MTLAGHILPFLKNLDLGVPLPGGFEAMNPFVNEETWKICEIFYNTYYNDTNKPVYPLLIPFVYKPNVALKTIGLRNRSFLLFLCMI